MHFQDAALYKLLETLWPLWSLCFFSCCCMFLPLPGPELTTQGLFS